ncbi:hypothetical protein BY458DRAFT_587512 [Sporodiniella umbellata]|nr:hypothetical protein BY458DRAFT_587512 [Sporodiniella umbellata]
MKAKEEMAESKQSIMDESVFKTILPENSELETEETGIFHWHIKDWKSLEDKCHSPTFVVKGFPWRILLFPKGNNQTKSFSFYVEVADPKDNSLPENWHICGQFAVAISNPTDPTVYYSSSANHRFSSEEIDWGFTRFYEIDDLDKVNNTKGGPYMVQNEIVLSVFLRAIKDETGVLWHNFVNYDSRKKTGYVGIKNQGATCYMNSLMQSLYCTNKLRKAVYDIPTENDEPTKSVALALQRCFYNLQYSSVPVGTTELTKSFGWDTLDAFMQHDVQEFNRVLQDNLEEKMKGTPADGAISQLFQGKTKSYIKCINVDYESSRVEDYYDIQLNVKGCKNLKDSFEDYVAEEILEGDNKYMAEGHGLQDAKKGVVFENFPPVLHLQLKRFEYDFQHDAMVKINDRHEFPEEINLDSYCSSCNPEEPYDYQLHGVLVHSGDLSGGHYFALIRPNKEDAWFRFDDDRVTPASKKEVYEENYGDEPLRDSKKFSPPTMNMKMNNARMVKKFTNAYMLVYIRKNKLDEILDPVVESDIPIHLKRRLDDEKALLETRKKERQDMQHNLKVAVVTDSSFKEYQGFNLAIFDDRYLEVSANVDVLKAPKTEKLVDFKQQIAEYYKLELKDFRLWLIQGHQSQQARVTRALAPTEESSTLEKLREVGSNGFVKLYLETTENENPLPALRNDQILLYLKYFDAKEQKLRGFGHIYVSQNDKVSSILSSLAERAGLKKSTSIQLFEEVRPLCVESVKTDQTFRKANFQHGDILCFQCNLSQREIEGLLKEGLIVTAPDYYNSLYNRTLIMFKPLPSIIDKKEVKIVLDRTSSYASIAKALAKEIGADANRIRFTASHVVTLQPREAIGYKPTLKLEDMVPYLPKPADYQQFISFDKMNTPCLFYELLEVDLADLESRRSIEVNVLGSNLRKDTKVTTLVPRSGTVTQLLDQIILKGKMEVKDPNKIRLFEVVDSRLIKEFSLEQPIDNVAVEENTTVYAEPISSDELSMDLDADRLVNVVHYHHSPDVLHSIPFRFVAIKGETFNETKKRLQKRTGMGDMEWKKVKFTILRNVHTTEPVVVPIDADDFELRAARLQEEDALGLDHTDKSSKGRFTQVFDKGIFIRG